MNRPTTPRLLLYACLACGLNANLLAVIGPLLPRLAARHDGSALFAALVQAGHPVGSLAAAVPTLLAARRFGTARTVVAGATLMALSTTLFAAPGTDWLAVGARLGQGAGSTLAWQPVIAWAVAAAGAGRTGRTFGMIFASSTLGSLAGPPLGALALAHGMELLLVPAALLVAATLPLLRQRPHVFAERAPARTIVSAFAGRAGVAGVALIAFAALEATALLVRGTLRLDAVGLSAGGIAAVLAAAAGTAALANPLLGRLYDRGRLRLLLSGSAACAAAALAVLARTSSPLVAAAAYVAAGGALASISVPAGALLSSVTARARLDQGVNLAVATIAWAPFALAGTLAAGLLPSARSTLTILALVAAAGAAAVAAVPPARPRGGAGRPRRYAAALGGVGGRARRSVPPTDELEV